MSQMKLLRETKTVPVIIINDDGNIIFINEKFTEVFGWKPDKLIGQPVLTIIPNNLHDAHNLGFSRFVLTEKSNILKKDIDLVALKSDHTEVTSTHCIYAEKVGGTWQFGATMTIKEN